MAVELPEPLQWVLELLAGARWPEADEDQLRAMADHWRKAAQTLESAAQGADAAVKRALEGQQGAAAEALGTHWSQYTSGKGTQDDPGFFPGLVDGCNGMGDMLEAMANSAETAKIEIIAQLGILAFDIATAEAEAPVTFGASMAQIPIVVAAIREVVGEILKKLLAEALEHAVKQAAQMAAINLMAQTIEVLQGHRKSIDGSELGQSALGGAVSGATGHLLGKGVGAAGGKAGLGGALDSLPGKALTGAAVGVGTDAATQAITTGHVDGGSLLGSGLGGAGGVGAHAAGGGLHGHGGGPHIPSTPHVPSAPHEGPVPRGGQPPTFSSSPHTGAPGGTAFRGPGGGAADHTPSSSAPGDRPTLTPFTPHGPSSTGLNSFTPGHGSSQPRAVGDPGAAPSGPHSAPSSDPLLSGPASSHSGVPSNLDVSPAAHPFYTGKQPVIDTGGRVEKFNQRYGTGSGAPQPTAPGAAVRPPGDRILSGPHEPGSSTASGIVIPDTAREKPQEGVVLATGPGRLDDGGPHHPLDIAPGDRIPDHPATPAPSRPQAYEPHVGIPAQDHTATPHAEPAGSHPAAPIGGIHLDGAAAPSEPAPTRAVPAGHTPAEAPAAPAARGIPEPPPLPTHSAAPAPPPPVDGARAEGIFDNRRTERQQELDQLRRGGGGQRVSDTAQSLGHDQRPAARPQHDEFLDRQRAERQQELDQLRRGGGGQRVSDTAQSLGHDQRPAARPQHDEFLDRQRAEREAELERLRTGSTVPVNDEVRGLWRRSEQLSHLPESDRLHEIDAMSLADRRKLSTNAQAVDRLRAGLPPEEFARTAAHLLVHVPEDVSAPISARTEAHAQVERMLQDPEVAERLLKGGATIGVAPKDQPQTTLPGLTHHAGQTFSSSAGGGRGYDEVRGSGGLNTAFTEENLTGDHTTVGGSPHYADGYSTTTHEFAHTIHRVGLGDADKKLISDTYAKKFNDPAAVWPDGTHKDNYSRTNDEEYFAQVTNAWLGTNHGDDPFSSQHRNNGPAWVRTHEPDLVPLLERLYGADPQAVHSAPTNQVRANTGQYDDFRTFWAGVDEHLPETPASAMVHQPPLPTHPAPAHENPFATPPESPSSEHGHHDLADPFADPPENPFTDHAYPLRE